MLEIQYSHPWDRNIRQFWCQGIRNVVSPSRVGQAHSGTYDVKECQRQNNLEKLCGMCVLDIFCTFLDKNEKNNQSPHWGRDKGNPILVSQDLQHPRLGKPRRGLHILDTRMGFNFWYHWINCFIISFYDINNLNFTVKQYGNPIDIFIKL